MKRARQLRWPDQEGLRVSRYSKISTAQFCGLAHYRGRACWHFCFRAKSKPVAAAKYIYVVGNCVDRLGHSCGATGNEMDAILKSSAQTEDGSHDAATASQPVHPQPWPP